MPQRTQTQATQTSRSSSAHANARRNRSRNGGSRPPAGGTAAIVETVIRQRMPLWLADANWGQLCPRNDARSCRAIQLYHAGVYIRPVSQILSMTHSPPILLHSCSERYCDCLAKPEGTADFHICRVFQNVHRRFAVVRIGHRNSWRPSSSQRLCCSGCQSPRQPSGRGLAVKTSSAVTLGSDQQRYHRH